MRQDLKNAIMIWMMEHPNTWQRTNACKEHFRAYIYDANGNYLEFGGKEVGKYVELAELVLYTIAGDSEVTIKL